MLFALSVYWYFDDFELFARNSIEALFHLTCIAFAVKLDSVFQQWRCSVSSEGLSGMADDAMQYWKLNKYCGVGDCSHSLCQFMVSFYRQNCLLLCNQATMLSPLFYCAAQLFLFNILNSVEGNIWNLFCGRI